MKVRDIMIKDPFTVREDSSFKEAAELIFEKCISGLPVVDVEGKCVGVVSEKDLLEVLFPTYTQLFELDNDTPLYTLDLENMEHKASEVRHIKIKDVMNRESVVIDVDTPVLQAASMMIVYHVRRLPVVEDKKLVGIVSQGDVFRAIFQKELGLTKTC